MFGPWLQLPSIDVGIRSSTSFALANPAFQLLFVAVENLRINSLAPSKC